LTKVEFHGLIGAVKSGGNVIAMVKRLAAALALCWHCVATAQITEENVASANQGFGAEQGRSAAWHFGQHKKLSAAIAALKPQRPGVVDAYIVVAGLDGDAVFGREAAQAARVLSRRYDGAGRTMLIAAGTGAADESVPSATPTNLATILGAVAAQMDLKEDVLILYATTHGAPRIGLAYRDGNSGYGAIAPLRLAGLITDLGIERRMVIISACYAGQFVAPLATPDTAVIAAADDNRTSFGCAPGNDWTYFGDALINTAFRKPQPLEAAVSEAFALIGTWEFARGLTASLPRSFVGEGAKKWLVALEKRMPVTTTAKVGRPAIEGETAAKSH
jgi:hypothetical protein